ncbi:unnamed protein product [Mesocestoides corti]|uniref:Transmembrane protein n=1 Tax=Mesocestoides corti TaxID=53468 RepID=A0A0R3UIN6_MESCO|nr:unnamed protein product [Mesocestoides corti]
MIEYCSKRILSIALLVLVIPTFTIAIPCNRNQSYQFTSSCQPCDQVDLKSVPECKETGFRTELLCLNGENGVGKNQTGQRVWVACDPTSFSDLRSERRSFVIFEFFVGICGLVSYVFVRKQHRILDQRLLDRVNRQIFSSS